MTSLIPASGEIQWVGQLCGEVTTSTEDPWKPCIWRSLRENRVKTLPSDSLVQVFLTGWLLFFQALFGPSGHLSEPPWAPSDPSQRLGLLLPPAREAETASSAKRRHDRDGGQGFPPAGAAQATAGATPAGHRARRGRRDPVDVLYTELIWARPLDWEA